MRSRRLSYIQKTDGKILAETDFEMVYPAKQFVTTRPSIERALKTIDVELKERLAELRDRGNSWKRSGLSRRTRFDMEMMREIGHCSGIENYSRHLAGRPPGSRPYCLLDYFPKTS